jgi:hypothetical protein
MTMNEETTYFEPTAEEIAAAARKQKELLAWAQSLTEEQVNALSDFGYYNAA